MVKVMIHEIDCENGTFVVVHDMNGDVVDEEESTTEASVEGAQEEEDVCEGVGDEPAGKRKRVIHKKPLINYKSRQTLVMFRRDIRLILQDTYHVPPDQIDEFLINAIENTKMREEFQKNMKALRSAVADPDLIASVQESPEDMEQNARRDASVNATIDSIKNMRTQYPSKLKRKILKAIAQEHGDDCEDWEEERIKKVLNKVKEKKFGYNNLKLCTVLEWARSVNSVSKKPGAKINRAFEQAVWSKLLIAVFTTESTDAQRCIRFARIIHNVTYDYAIIRLAAVETSLEPEFTDDPDIQKKKFTNPWIRGLLKRQRFSRRKITRDLKNYPPTEEIIATMKKGQDLFVSEGHTEETNWNMDETGITYAIEPTHLYCSKQAQRASTAGGGDAKLRITAAVAGNNAGKFAPLFMILKHSKSSQERPDQSTMMVISNLHRKDDGFGLSDGWELKEWSRTMAFGRNEAEKLHTVKYIIHAESGRVITSQVKAWNDSVRMAMYIDLILAPIKLRDGKMLLWMDNCSLHKTPSVEQVFAEHGITVVFLPPNMTGVLQVHAQRIIHLIFHSIYTINF